MEFEVKRITNGPKHHLFGFHDLVQTNAKGDLALCLEVDDISHPPLPGDTCLSGIVPADGGEFAPIHKTHTWNYPQGARQQWIGDSDLFTCNDRDADGKLISWISDAHSGKVIERLPFPIHCVNAHTRKAFWINYDRLYATGAYGYVPNKATAIRRISDLPDNDGLWVADMGVKNQGELLVPMTAIAACGETHPIKTGFPHYITHPMLNPSGTRIAFLHRYRIVDGGETTRLMTVGVDGTGLRCLAKGFLSHFTWTADDELFIWGAHLPVLFAMREASYLRIPGILPVLSAAKSAYRLLRGAAHRSSGSKTQDKAFLKIKDVEGAAIEKTAVGVILEDGHPMARPGDLRTVISDSYPDALGDRQLYLYNIDNGKRINIGTFRRVFEVPDKAKFDYRDVQGGTDPRVVKRLDIDQYLFARSGLHCDLHPRWSHDGKSVFFDSIHEGMRQIYQVKIGSL